MNKYKILVVLVVIVLFVIVGVVLVQIVIGGGVLLLVDFYKGLVDSILLVNFIYVVIGLGIGKKVFLENNLVLFLIIGIVYFVGSDLVLSSIELSNYIINFNQLINVNCYGVLIQVLLVVILVIILFNKVGLVVDLSVVQICGVFLGVISDWLIIDVNCSGLIQVVYCLESSGISEMFSCFLIVVCVVENVEILKLVGGKFVIKLIFVDLYKCDVNGNLLVFLVVVLIIGGILLYNIVYVVEGCIGYVGLDVILSLIDVIKVVKVKGFLLDQVSVQVILDIVVLLIGIDVENFVNWVLVFGNLLVGYLIVGYINLVIGQCYKDLSVVISLCGFLVCYYLVIYIVVYEKLIIDYGFILLIKVWCDVICNCFVLVSSIVGLNNFSICVGIGCLL